MKRLLLLFSLTCVSAVSAQQDFYGPTSILNRAPIPTDPASSATPLPHGMTITPGQAADNIGRDSHVLGIVSEVSVDGKGTTFLNFGGKGSRSIFTAVIFPKNATKFGDLKKYAGKKVVVSGMIKDYSGKPEIILFSPKQITLVK